jgi:hypothetical protein
MVNITEAERETVDYAVSLLCHKSDSQLLDENKISWKWVDGEWIGKRSVWTKDWRACWLEETTPEDVKSWWCGGPDVDYTEIFRRNFNKELIDELFSSIGRT